MMDPADIQPTSTKHVASSRAPIISPSGAPGKQKNPGPAKKAVPPKKMKTPVRFAVPKAPKVPTGQIGKRRLAGLYLRGDMLPLDGRIGNYIDEEDLDVMKRYDEVS